MWPFKKKNPAPTKTVAELRAFCEKELERLEPKGIGFKEIVETPKSQIGCVAGEILKDLSLENFDKWKFPYEKGFLDTWYYHASMVGREYTLTINHRNWMYNNLREEGTFVVRLMGFSEFSFSKEEQKAISDAFEKYVDHENELKRLAKVKDEQEQLNKLFPACAPTKNGVFCEN